LWEHAEVEVYGEATLARFSKKYPLSRRALQRFLAIVRQSNWPHFAAVKNTFAATDYVAGRLVFDIGGNKYRIVASVDFQEQILVVDEVMTHEQYDRKTI
jgi:mRNA interferase HigB